MPEANDSTRETGVLVFNNHNFGELDLPTFCNSSRSIQKRRSFCRVTEEFNEADSLRKADGIRM